MSDRQRRRDLVAVTLAALAVRLVWNLKIHPPLDYVFADMAGYLERARTIVEAPAQRMPSFTLFPWGTHAALSIVDRAFGPDNRTAVGVLYALAGAAAVGYGFALARRFTRSVWISRAVGALLVVYYPWISLGGYVLSEPLFTPFVTAAAFHGLSYADRGRARDAWLFGAALALGALFRPQILAALPLYGIHALIHRRAYRRVRLRALLPAVAAPLALVAVVSAARMRFHTGSYGFVSSNGPLNFAFGRCHATMISAISPDRKSHFSPPSFNALAQHDAEHPDAFFELDPAMGPKLSFDGHMWEARPLRWLAAECVRATGVLRQARYALTHVALLWFFNPPWPDKNTPFKGVAEVAESLHEALILPAALVAVALAFRRRHARAMLLGVHVLGLVLVAAVFFGETRLRAPYDGILVTLAAAAYAGGVSRIRRRHFTSTASGNNPPWRRRMT